jgi:hypothetical protein
MKKIRLLLLALIASVSFIGIATPVYAADDARNSVCEGIGAVGDTTSCAEDPTGVTVTKLVRTIVRILSYVVGAVSIIMIIIGSLKYITSTGDSAKVTSAKNTIIYAVIGIIIAVLAQLIIRFVITEVTTDQSLTNPTEECQDAFCRGELPDLDPDTVPECDDAFCRGEP